MPFDPQEIARWTSGDWQGGLPGKLTGFAFDAREIRPGELFFALGGVRDGHDFVPQAARNGAAGAVVARTVEAALPQLVVRDPLEAMAAIAHAQRSRFSGPVVGITGSSGKTSTKEMLHRLLGRERCHATAGNWNNRIGVPMTLFGLDSTRHDFAVIEAGINQPGEMAELGRMIEADLTILTHIGPAHLELLGSLDGIANEKSMLALSARPSAPLVLPAAALAYPAYAALAERAIAAVGEGERLPTFPARRVDYRFLSSDYAGTRFRLDSEVLKGEFFVHSRSRGISVNAVLAAVAAAELGVDAEAIRCRLAEWRPAASRGQLRQVGPRLYYVDCYNANPASMADALPAFVGSVPKILPRYYVLGAMNELGDEASRWHRETAARIPFRAGDRLAFVGPGALVAAYREGALEAGWPGDRVDCVENAENLKSRIDRFEGAVFLKGSRSYALETLLGEAR